MCVITAINARLKKINRAINAIKKINRLTVLETSAPDTAHSPNDSTLPAILAR